MNTLRLVIVSGNHAGKTVPLKDGRLLVGRSPECGAVLSSPEVSRKHCVFAEETGGLVVEDLRSRNGTFVNGERIGLRTRLKDGDVVRIGVLDILVSQEQPGKEVSEWVRDEAHHDPTTPQPTPEPSPTSPPIENIKESRLHPGTMEKPPKRSAHDAAEEALRKFFGRG